MNGVHAVGIHIAVSYTHLVIATVFRAGLPLHAGFLNVIDRAGNAFVSAYRYYKDKECRTVCLSLIHIYLVGCKLRKAAPKQAENVGVGSVIPRSVPASLAVKPDRK